jgi:hypothetical protein
MYNVALTPKPSLILPSTLCMNVPFVSLVSTLEKFYFFYLSVFSFDLDHTYLGPTLHHLLFVETQPFRISPFIGLWFLFFK